MRHTRAEIQRVPTMTPRDLTFIAKPKRTNAFDDEDDGCRGCMFERERSTVCHEACREATKRGLADCDDGFIYVAAKIDIRQQGLFGMDAL